MAVTINGLHLAEAKRGFYRVQAEAGDEPDAVLKPDWWKHVAVRLRAFDRIEIVGYDGRWFAEVVVLHVGKNGIGGARVGFLVGPVDLSNADRTGEPVPEYDVAWAGPSAMWRVVRKADQHIVKSGFSTKEAGLAWIAESNNKPMAAAA